LRGYHPYSKTCFDEAHVIFFLKLFEFLTTLHAQLIRVGNRSHRLKSVVLFFKVAVYLLLFRPFRSITQSSVNNEIKLPFLSEMSHHSCWGKPLEICCTFRHDPVKENYEKPRKASVYLIDSYNFH